MPGPSGIMLHGVYSTLGSVLANGARLRSVKPDSIQKLAMSYFGSQPKDPHQINSEYHFFSS